ncbi:hypothetical protein FSARC_1665 [Fusarium sarcochroum]|uniref:DUF7730 domain-containing protein n=1 Tax=Fusarium sarcochroum TaxID=1208366 RepID=A0A8H4U820_9HYPO|nr:hypothetical protein FSARC_1665 [Fusarium sarcochroum]
MSCSALPTQAKPSTLERSKQLQSPLFRLPAEVRIMIYLALLGGRLLLIQMPKVSLFWLQGHESNPKFTKWGHFTCLEDPEKTSQYVLGVGDGSDQVCLALLQTCQRVRDEGIELLYSSNVFLFDRPKVFYQFYRRFAALQPYASIEIRLNLYLTQYVIHDVLALQRSFKKLSCRPGNTRMRFRVNKYEQRRNVQSFCHFVGRLFGNTDVQVDIFLSPNMREAFKPIFRKCDGITVRRLLDFCEEEEEEEEERVTGSETEESEAGQDSEDAWDEGSMFDSEDAWDESSMFDSKEAWDEARVFGDLE